MSAMKVKKVKAPPMQNELLFSRRTFSFLENDDVTNRKVFYIILLHNTRTQQKERKILCQRLLNRFPYFEGWGLVSKCYKLVQGFRVPCLFTGQYIVKVMTQLQMFNSCWLDHLLVGWIEELLLPQSFITLKI